jgi:DNA-directed RNA polymerase specialized sigma24 family protein
LNSTASFFRPYLNSAHDRIEEIEDDARRHSTEDVADDLGIDLGDRVTELENEEALEDIDDLLDDLPDEERD